MGVKILVINPGSTSTKIAMYEDEKRLWDASIEHTLEELSQYKTISDQIDMRHDLVMQSLAENKTKPEDLSIVVSRGGPFARVSSGAYEVTEEMLDKMRNDPQDQHAANTGMEIAYRIAKANGIKAYIYDAVTVDELLPIVRIVGIKGMARRGQGHNLNSRAAAIKLCKEKGWDYHEKTFVIAHLGGGITISIHHHGRIADIVVDDEGPFSPERAGGVPIFQLIDLIYDEKPSKKDLLRSYQREGGLISLLGTADTREVEKRIEGGDEEAKLIYEAMALNVAKNIAKESVVYNGKIDAIILTGGIAYSEYFTGMIRERISFIAPVHIMPGENEMEALALGGLRVLRGEETAKQYKKSV